mgnify:CR=1 FL=1
MPSPDSSATVAPRTVLVTGAGKRLGREIALTLARAGWNVAVHHRHSAADAQQTVGDCTALTGRANSAAPFFADLADESSVRALLPQLISTLPASVDVAILTDRTQSIRASVRDVQKELVLIYSLLSTHFFRYFQT